MAVAQFLGFSASFVPFTIVVAAIAVSVVQRNLRAPIMFAGLVFSSLLFASFLQITLTLLQRQVNGAAGDDPAAGGGVADRLRTGLMNAAAQGAYGCNTLVLPYITTGLIPRANAFFLAWVTAYLAWSQSQWAKAGGTPTNPFVWVGIALAWVLTGWTWNTLYNGQTCAGPWGSAATMLAGTVLGLTWGAIIGAVSPTSLYFAPLASDNVVCTAPRKQVLSCTIGGSTPTD